MVPFSILDLSPVADGTTIGQSFAASKRMAQKAEEFGYTRFWMAEHHGMPGVASAATSVILGQIGAVTKTIRIGSGGVMAARECNGILLVPDVIAGCHHIGAGIDRLQKNVLGDTEAAGGVLAVHHHEIEAIALAQGGQRLDDGAAP